MSAWPRRFAVAIVVVAALAALAPVSAWTVEGAYSRGLYATLQRTLTPVSNLTALAWIDGVLGVAAVAFVRRWWRVVRPRARDGRGREAARAARWTLVAAALAYLAFLALWGLNYRRVPLMERLLVDRQRVTPVVAARLLEDAVTSLNRLHAPAHAASPPAAHAVPAALADAFARAESRFGLASATVPGRPKATLLGAYFRAAGVAGLINPFGLEVMMTPDALPVERPAILAHEWGHLAGYADEAEASFVGWLVCQSGDELAQYSAWLEILPRAAPSVLADERRRLLEALAPGPREDFQAIEARLQRVVPAVRTVAWESYDQYLRANRVEGGIASYDRVITLVLASGVGERWLPEGPLAATGRPSGR